MDVMAYKFISGQIAIWRIKNKYIFFSKKLTMWKSIRWPGPFVKEVLVDREDYCIFVSGATENFIFWLILILLV